MQEGLAAVREGSEEPQTHPRSGRVPAHPFLIALFPVLFLYQANADEVTIGQAALPLLASVALAGLVYLVAGAVLKNAGRAALATSTFLFFFFSYGHIARALGETRIGPIAPAGDKFLVPVLGSLFLLMIWRIARAGATVNLNKLVTVAAAAMVLMAVVQVVAGGGAKVQGEVTAGPPLLKPLSAAQLADARDIYYLVFDRYTSDRLLQERYGFDNSAFTEGLRSRGFTVVDDARANYVDTIQSIASSLNLEHLAPLTQDEAGDHWGPVRDLIRTHRIGRSLKAAGYEYHHLGSWSEMSRVTPIADQNYQLNAQSEFVRVFLRTTAYRLLGEVLDVGIFGTQDHRAEHREIALHQYRSLEQIARADRSRPRFVFAHILQPHPPYVFDADGGVVTAEEQFSRVRRINYVEQLKYTNKRIEQLLDVLLTGPEDERPIVIIQSDEGMYPGRWLETNEAYHLRPTAPNITPAELREKYGILNALYLPGVQDPGIDDNFTPVNEFRKVLNLYFGTSLPMLPDRSFIYTDPNERYTFKDITDAMENDR